MKLMLTTVAVVAAMVCSSVMAQEAGAGKHKAKADAAVAAAVDMTVKGTIAKSEETNKKGVVVVHYTLTEADGKVVTLPEAHAGHKSKDAPAAAFNFADYVGKTVTVIGKGVETKKGAHLTEVTKVDVETAAAPVVPAAAK